MKTTREMKRILTGMLSATLIGAMLLTTPSFTQAVLASVSASEAKPVQSVEETISDGKIADKTEPVVSENVLPESPVSDNEVSENDVPDSTVSENVISENAVSENHVSENAVSDNNVNQTLSAAMMSEKMALNDAFSDLDEEKEGTDYVSDEVILLCDDEEEAQSAAESFGATLKSFDEGVAVLSLDGKEKSITGKVISSVKSAVAEAAKSDNSFPAVYPNFIRHTNSVDTGNESFGDPFTKSTNQCYQWYHELVNSKFAWAADKTGAIANPVVVAVLDTGVLSTHEDLTNVVEAISKSGDTSPIDTNGHGTNVSGIIAGTANSVGGRGVAPGVKIMSIKVSESETKSYGMYDSSILAAIRYATDSAKNVRVINMSLGGTSYSPAYIPVIREAREKGIVIVAAAGNESTSGYSYPAAYDGVISVAALNKNMKKADFSNYGNRVDIAAPGGEGYLTSKATAAERFRYAELIFSSYCDGSSSYIGMAGTSQASPIVAAAAALVISYNDDFYSNKTLVTSQDVEDVLKGTAKKLSGVSGCGTGCVDIAAALGISTTMTAPSSNIPNKTKIAAGTQVTLSAQSEDASIYYTLNGKTPKMTTENRYTGPITLNGKGKVTVKAFSVLYGKKSSVATYTYTYDDSLVKSIDVYSVNGSSEVAVNKKLTLSTEVLPVYAKNKAVTWTTSDPTIATVSTKGVVTGKKAGTVTINATAKDTSGFSDSIDLEVKAVATSITIDESIKRVEKNVGESFVISADKYTVLPAEASQKVTFKSSKAKIASVTAEGVVVAHKSGTATITVKTADGSGKTVKLNVVVKTPVTKLGINDKNKTTPGKVAAGKKWTPVVTYNDGTSVPDNKKLSWKIVSDESSVVKKINASTGVVEIKTGLTARATVVVKATATDGSGIEASYTINVYPITTKIRLEMTSDIAEVGSYTNFISQFVNTVEPENTTMEEFSYSSSNSKIISIDKKTGFLRLLKPGIATLTIKALDGSNKTAKLTLRSVQLAESVNTVNNSGTRVLAPGKSLTLKAVTSPSNISLKRLIWESKDTSLAKVKNGKVTAAKNISSEQTVDIVLYDFYSGNAGITTVTLYPKATTSITITDSSSKEELNKKTSTLLIGNTMKFSASSAPAEACQGLYTYTTSNKKVAKVYTDGTIKAVGAGTATIKVKAVDGTGKTATFKVKVSKSQTK